jgi:hypothetical protein
LTAKVSETISGERIDLSPQDIPTGWRMKIVMGPVKTYYLSYGSKPSAPISETVPQRELFSQIMTHAGVSEAHGVVRGLKLSINDELRNSVPLLQTEENIFLRQESVGNLTKRKRKMLNAPWLFDPKKIILPRLVENNVVNVTRDKHLVSLMRSTWKDFGIATERYGYSELRPYLIETEFYQGFPVQRSLVRWWQDIALPRPFPLNGLLGQMYTTYVTRRRVCL